MELVNLLYWPDYIVARVSGTGLESPRQEAILLVSEDPAQLPRHDKSLIPACFCGVDCVLGDYERIDRRGRRVRPVPGSGLPESRYLAFLWRSRDARVKWNNVGLICTNLGIPVVGGSGSPAPNWYL